MLVMATLHYDTIHGVLGCYLDGIPGIGIDLVHKLPHCGGQGVAGKGYSRVMMFSTFKYPAEPRFIKRFIYYCVVR